MTVYVDDMEAEFRGMKMCHMVADSDEELHAMAALLGLKRAWHQAPPKHDSHYDLALSKRSLAVKLGAVQITLRQLAAACWRRRETGELGDPKDAEAWVHERHKTKEKTS